MTEWKNPTEDFPGEQNRPHPISLGGEANFPTAFNRWLVLLDFS